ncbi:hypothetical protein ACEQ8H_001704 [Pleosporales sp. CAS-2024a]
MHFSGQAIYFAVTFLSSSTAVLAAVQPGGRCGGFNFQGETTCVQGWKCLKYNPWFSQCVIDNMNQPTPSPSAVAAGCSMGGASSHVSGTPGNNSSPGNGTPGHNVLPGHDVVPGNRAGLSSTLTTMIASSTTSSTSSATSSSSSTKSSAAPRPTSIGPNGEACSLDQAFKAHGKKYIGVATDKYLLTTGQTGQIIINDFGQVTPENSMKWDATEPSEGQFTLQNADFLVDWATSHGKLIRGHTTVWHSQLPTWVSSISDPTKLQEVMVAHIKKLVGTYAGKVYAWDIINEMFDESGGFRSTVFYNVLGEDFVKIAFTTARAADPNAKLYINDFNLDSPSYPKTKGLATHVKAWLAAGTPIDGVGSQSHLGGTWPISDIAGALRLICADVEECAMTELDIRGAAPSDYKTAVAACLDEDKCVGITIWGVSDANSWRKGENPLLFDANMQAKPAYAALCSLLE